MPIDRPSEARLVRLKSFESLPGDLRNALRAHLIHDVPLIDALSIVGRRNPTRDAAQERLQQAIAAFKGDESALTVDDLVEQLETARKAPILAEWARRAAEAPTPSNLDLTVPEAVTIAPQSPRSDPQEVDATQVPPEMPPQIEPVAEWPAAPAEAPQFRNIVHADELFPNITAENLQHWRRQSDMEGAERRRLINEFSHEQEMNKWR